MLPTKSNGATSNEQFHLQEKYIQLGTSSVKMFNIFSQNLILWVKKEQQQQLPAVKTKEKLYIKRAKV